MIHTTTANADFELAHVTVDDALGQAYLMHVQYDFPLVPVRLTLRNCIFRGSGPNTSIWVAGATTLGAVSNLLYIPSGTAVLHHGSKEYTAADIGTLGSGNLHGDPRFVHPAWGSEGDYRLQAGSPAIDSGTSAGVPEADIECRARVDDPATVDTGTGSKAYFDRGAYELGGTLGTCPESPAVDFVMSKATYRTGDTVTASGFKIRNRAAAPAAVRLTLWLVVPGVGKVVLADIGSDGAFRLPANLDVDAGPLTLMQVSTGFPPRGAWELDARLEEPISGRKLNEDRNPFTIE